MAEPFFVAPKLLVGHKNMWEPKEKKNKNIIKVKKNPTYEMDKQVNQGKMTPEELQATFDAAKGTGTHNTSKKDEGKRKTNPYKGDNDY